MGFLGKEGLVAAVDAFDDLRNLFTSSSRRCEALASVSVMLASCLLSRLLDAAELARRLRSMAGEVTSVGRGGRAVEQLGEE